MTYLAIVIFVILAVIFQADVCCGKRASIKSNDVASAQYYSLNPSFRKPTFMRYVNNKRHEPGSDVILPCMTSGMRPMYYTWMFNGQYLLEKRSRLRFSHKRSMLKIKRIRDVDVGLYTCMSTNVYGNLSFTFNIKLKEKRQQPVFYDHVIMLRKQFTVRPTSHSIRMNCHAESQDVVHYIWLKNGKPFMHVKPSQNGKEKTYNGGDLVLSNLKVNDGGQYTCVAFNKYGNISFTYELRILRKLSGGPPKVIPFTRPDTIHAHVGESVSFECLEIISVTIPDVRWFHLYNNKNRRQLPKLPSKINWDNINSENLQYGSSYLPANQYSTFKITSNQKPENDYLFDDTDPSGLRLTLKNVTVEHTGTYACFVSNFEGNDYALFHLLVADNE